MSTITLLTIILFILMWIVGGKRGLASFSSVALNFILLFLTVIFISIGIPALWTTIFASHYQISNHCNFWTQSQKCLVCSNKLSQSLWLYHLFGEYRDWSKCDVVLLAFLKSQKSDIPPKIPCWWKFWKRSCVWHDDSLIAETVDTKKYIVLVR